MPVIKSTSKFADDVGIKILIYGAAGVGKTTAFASAPAPLIVSAEGGLLSVADQDLPYVNIDSLADLREIYGWLKAGKHDYKTICVDSLSEICDLWVREYRGDTDAAKMYPKMRTAVLNLLHGFRDLKYNVVFTARETAQEIKRRAETITIVKPAVMGNKLQDDLPYVFDVVMRMVVEYQDTRRVYTACEGDTVAKDRTGKLPAVFNVQDGFLTKVFNVISGKEVKSEG